MKAEEAKKISESNKLHLEDALADIGSSCNDGHDSCMFPNLHPEAVNELMRLGYKVTIFKDPIIGTENHLVSW